MTGKTMASSMEVNYTILRARRVPLILEDGWAHRWMANNYRWHNLQCNTEVLRIEYSYNLSCSRKIAGGADFGKESSCRRVVGMWWWSWRGRPGSWRPFARRSAAG